MILDGGHSYNRPRPKSRPKLPSGKSAVGRSDSAVIADLEHEIRVLKAGKKGVERELEQYKQTSSRYKKICDERYQEIKDLKQRNKELGMQLRGEI